MTPLDEAPEQRWRRTVDRRNRPAKLKVDRLLRDFGYAELDPEVGDAIEARLAAVALAVAPSLRGAAAGEVVTIYANDSAAVEEGDAGAAASETGEEPAAAADVAQMVSYLKQQVLDARAEAERLRTELDRRIATRLDSEREKEAIIAEQAEALEEQRRQLAELGAALDSTRHALAETRDEIRRAVGELQALPEPEPEPEVDEATFDLAPPPSEPEPEPVGRGDEDVVALEEPEASEFALEEPEAADFDLEPEPVGGGGADVVALEEPEASEFALEEPEAADFDLEPPASAAGEDHAGDAEEPDFELGEAPPMARAEEPEFDFAEPDAPEPVPLQSDAAEPADDERADDERADDERADDERADDERADNGDVSLALSSEWLPADLQPQPDDRGPAAEASPAARGDADLDGDDRLTDFDDFLYDADELYEPDHPGASAAGGEAIEPGAEVQWRDEPATALPPPPPAPPSPWADEADAPLPAADRPKLGKVLRGRGGRGRGRGRWEGSCTFCGRLPLESRRKDLEAAGWDLDDEAAACPQCRGVG